MTLSLSFLVVGATAFAQGKGQGANRALAAAARGSSNSGIARASQSAVRSQIGSSRSATSLGRSANGLGRAANGLSKSQALAKQSSNALRIRDKRLQQADHLRDISSQNGNERLLDTADRMQESAQRNYDRSIGGEVVESPAENLEPVGEEVNLHADTDPTKPVGETSSAKKPRSSWLPAWLRSKP